MTPLYKQTIRPMVGGAALLPPLSQVTTQTDKFSSIRCDYLLCMFNHAVSCRFMLVHAGSCQVMRIYPHSMTILINNILKIIPNPRNYA